MNNFKQHLLVNCEELLVPFVNIGSYSSLVSGGGFKAGNVIVLVVFTPLEDLMKNCPRHVWERNNFPGDDLPTKVCA